MKAINRAQADKALNAMKATYGQLVEDGIDPTAIVIAMSEIIAYCLAHKAVSGGGDQAYDIWLRPFTQSYREQLKSLSVSRSGEEPTP